MGEVVEDLFLGDGFSLKRIIVGISLGVFLSVLVILVTFSNVRDVDFGADIINYYADDDSALIELAAGANNENITGIIFTFTDANGVEYNYETSEGIQNISIPYTRFLFWKSLKGSYGYSINASDVGLENFEDIVSVKVGFSYETEKENEGDVSKTVKTKTLATTASETDSSGGSGGGNPPTTSPVNDSNNETEPVCVPDVTCGSGDCDNIDNGCGGQLYCGECSLPCDVGVNCFYVSVTGAGTHNGSSVNNAMNLTEAKIISKPKPGSTFLLLSGNYGPVTFGQDHGYYGKDYYATNWSMPIKYKAATGADVVFDNLNVYAHGDEPKKDRFLILEGFKVINNVMGTPMTVSTVSSIKLINLTIMGTPGAVYSDVTSMYGLIVKNTKGDYFMNDILVERVDVSESGVGMEFQGNINNLVVRNNHIHDTHGSAIKPALSPTSGMFIIENNLIHDQNPLPNTAGTDGNHGSGIAAHNNNMIIRNNTIYDYGNTRPIRFYQGPVAGIPVVGPNGYENVSIENNLVYVTANPKYGNRYNNYIEIIDMGKNFTIRNNTLSGALSIFLVAGYNGSELYLYNNLFSGSGIGIDYYSDSSTISCAEARVPYENVHEGNNIYPNSLTSRGEGYLCWYDTFNSKSNSLVQYNVHNSRTGDNEPARQWFRDLFVDYDNDDLRPSPNNIVCNGTLWNTPIGVNAAGKFACV